MTDEKTSKTRAATHPKKKEEVERIRIKLRAFDHKILDQASLTIMDTARRTGANTIGPIPLPTERTRYTVLRSSFVYKDAREQYEMQVHKRLIDILDPKPETVNALMNLNLPAGVEVEIKM